MNVTLSTEPRQREHQRAYEQLPVRRVSVVDRLALHVGVALIKWGRRTRNSESRERRASRVEQQLARLERERHYERQFRLGNPVR